VTHQIGVAWLAAAVLLRQQADDPSLDDTLRQACLRRSISTAYYAVFHLITGETRLWFAWTLMSLQWHIAYGDP